MTPSLTVKGHYTVVITTTSCTCLYCMSLQRLFQHCDFTPVFHHSLSKMSNQLKLCRPTTGLPLAVSHCQCLLVHSVLSFIIVAAAFFTPSCRIVTDESTMASPLWCYVPLYKAATAWLLTFALGLSFLSLRHCYACTVWNIPIPRHI